MDKDLIWDFIIENDIATEKELNLITCIIGYSAEALNKVIYSRTLYHDVDQCLSCEPDIFSI